jgi:hypothetical protein
MNKLEAGKTVELSDEWNQYEVLKADDKFALLKCVAFVRQEDLGDQIICARHNQEIWVAQFHAWKYEESAAAEPSVRHKAELAGEVARVMVESIATAQAPKQLKAMRDDAMGANLTTTRPALKRG